MGNTPWLFEAPDTAAAQKGKWRAQRLLMKLRKRQRAVGIKHGSLHTFRHTGASILANDPVHPMALPKLQRFLGHRRTSTTEIYLHASADDVGEALRRVDFARLAKPSQSGVKQDLKPSPSQDGPDAQTRKESK